MMRGLHVGSLWLSLAALAAGFRAPSVTGHCGVPALAACAKESLSRRSLLAVVLAGSRRATGSTAQSPALACAVEGSGGGDTAAAMAEVDALIAQRAGASRFTLTPKSAAMEDAIQTLRACNPTDAPGVWDSPEKTRRLADGEWHVLYAPHMFRLQTLLATEFGPRLITCCLGLLHAPAFAYAASPHAYTSQIQDAVPVTPPLQVYLGVSRRAAESHRVQRALRVQPVWQWLAQCCRHLRLGPLSTHGVNPQA